MTPTAPGSGGDSGGAWLTRIGELFGIVLAPVTVLTALLYDFGFVRAQALFGYFGLEVSQLDFSFQDLVLRSAQVVFRPLIFLAFLVLLTLAGHALLTRQLRRRPPTSRVARGASPATGLVAMLLFLTAAGSLDLINLKLIPVRVAPVALGMAAVLTEYAVHLAEQQCHRRRRRRARRGPPPPLMSAPLTRLRRATLAATLLIALFWGFSVEADRQGNQLARGIAATVGQRSAAIVYSTDRLPLSPDYQVDEVDLTPAKTIWRWRYTGLHVLAYRANRWFLLPTSWTKDNGAPVVILTEDPTRLRVDIVP
ncbi:hypothetical protein ThrDRAFT_04356 [Frankia casuarinae]|nr:MULTISPECIES: hypothetical protein [Frankia]ETA00328.1 hypothetical protein CcI6DRAFT_04270 [Frankia sp. CcI6]EYT90037.1 hypothetical protein ThrDRAFT_04356 [Frankia casuarinae]KDA40527.1 hypothetical protein BMG523Draft_04666 [Frankia sp. BMG5.23]KEZ35573.1 hypothetical protein CEDDRAFT_03008 [Frankia sp. CeD]OAA23131.1 hypothetical protein AAY23_105772 [Frankia casuarinae]